MSAHARSLSNFNEIENVSRAFDYVNHLLADIKQETNQTFSGRVVVLYVFTLDELMTQCMLFNF